MSLAKRWLELIASDLQDFAGGSHFGFETDCGIPGYVRRAEEKLRRAIFPAELKDREALNPEKVGRVLGQTYASFAWILDFMKRESSMFRDRLHREVKEVLRDEYREGEEEWMQTQVEVAFALHFSRFQHVLERALALVIEQPFIESARFFRGFHAAVSLRAKDDTAWSEKLSAASVYFVIQRDWVVIRKFRTVSELHAFLQLKLGINAAGALNRTQILAKRIGLRLAARGRPIEKIGRTP